MDRPRRPSPEPLGEGVWRRVHDRFARAVMRFETIVDGVEVRPVRLQLVEVADQLDVVLLHVRDACARAQQVAPADGFDVPRFDDGHWLGVHRHLSKAGTLCAQACEAAMNARVAARLHRSHDLQSSMDDVRRAVAQLSEHAHQALELPTARSGR